MQVPNGRSRPGSSASLRMRDLDVIWGTPLPEFYTSAMEMEDTTGRVQGFAGRAARDCLTAIQQRRSAVEVLP